MAGSGSGTACSQCVWLGSQRHLPAAAPGDGFGLGLARPLAVGAGGGGGGRFRGSARSGLHRPAHASVEAHVVAAWQCALSSRRAGSAHQLWGG